MSEAALLDSNICIYLLRGEPLALRDRLLAQEVGSLFLSTISLAELALRDSLATLAPVLQLATVVPFDESAALVYGQLPFRRNSFDRLIAAHALALNLTLVTNNEAHFADVPGLHVENWTTP